MRGDGTRRTAGLAAAARWLVAGSLMAALAAAPARAQTAPSPRVALVIGIGGYRAGAMPAAADDAGLVAQTLAGAGFDVTAARDLDGDGLRRAFRDFLDKAGAAGPDGIAFVYLAGRAIQSDGDNYFVPIDAQLARPADVPIETVRLGDFTHALAALPIEAKVVVVDGAYAGAPASASSPGAPGLALVDAERGELLAFNAAPGTMAPATSGPYGAYAQALVQSMNQGGVPVGDIFARVRVAVDQATGGAEVPWDSDKLTRSFTFFDRSASAPAVASAQIPVATLEKRPIREFPPDQAYAVALARDTLPAYADFLAAFPDNPLARRIRLIVAVRREALFWRAATGAGSPGALWTYLDRYPRGPHAADARRLLSRLAAALAPPPSFRPLVFDVPPPPPEDVVIVERPVIFIAPDLPPPPPPPVFLLPPPVVVVLARPAPPPGPRLLPIPVPVGIPVVRPIFEPGVIAPPRGVSGNYPRARPFRRGPGGDGLVVQEGPGAGAPEPEPPQQRPAPGRPVPPSVGPQAPTVPPAAPGRGEGAPPVRPGVLPPAPTAPPPAVRPPPAPPPQVAPAAPPPAGAPPPERRPGPPPRPTPPGAQPPPNPLPDGMAPAPHAGRPPGEPGAGPAGDGSRRPAAPLPAPEPRPAAPPPAPEPRPQAPPRPAPEIAPRPMAAPPESPRPVAPPRPEPRAPEGAPPGGPRPPEPGAGREPDTARPPEARHPACGHPGEPPCRP